LAPWLQSTSPRTCARGVGLPGVGLAVGSGVEDLRRLRLAVGLAVGVGVGVEVGVGVGSESVTVSGWPSGPALA
jgi:hypothetical protein